MGKRLGLVFGAVILVAASAVLEAPAALAGNCTNPCLGLGIADNLNASQPPSVDATSGGQLLDGSRSWDFSIQNGYGAGTATNVSIGAQSDYPASSFDGVGGFPVTTSTAALDPNESLDLPLNSSIPASFATGFDSSRSMEPQIVPVGGGLQVVDVTFTRTNAAACSTNTPGSEGCSFSGDVQTALAGAVVTGVTAPSNLDQSEGFSSSLDPSRADWTLNDPILSKTYTVSVTISLPIQEHAYFYKPWVHLVLGNSGPHGCEQDVCAGPSTSVTLPDSSLDGRVPGAGQLTFSADQSFLWDEGGRQPSTQIQYTEVQTTVSETTPAWTAYVANGLSHSVTPIDTASNTAGTPITVGSGPFGIAVTPTGTTAYVVNACFAECPGTVTPIDTATNTSGAAIPVGSNPLGIAITPDGKTAYVTNDFSNNVTPIDTVTNSPGAAIPVGVDPFGIAITPDGTTAYVVNAQSNNVTPIDTATNTAGTPITVGTEPFGIAITPDGKTAYVTNYGAGTVTPIDTATNTAGTPITIGTNPFGVAISADGTTAYVANAASNNVTPINTATNTAGTPITVGTQPVAIAITPDGTTAYVVNALSNNVTPINTATNTAGTPITVGTNPRGIAITPDQAPVARLSVTPAQSGSATSFDASASTVGFGSIATYAWNFGDGSTGTTSTPTTTHTYAAGGTFTATVTETSGAGTSTSQVFTGQTMSRNGGPAAQAQQSFTVLQTTSTAIAATPDPANPTAVVDYTATVTPAPTGGTVTFHADGPAVAACTNVALSAGGQATCAQTYATTGSHAVYAVYNPSVGYVGSTSPTLGETVAKCGQSLAGCNLKGANLQNANLAGVNLQGANLKSANLAGTDLAGSNLAGSNLKGATLTGAILVGTNLNGANMQGAIPTGVVWMNTTCPDGTNSNNDGDTCANNL